LAADYNADWRVIECICSDEAIHRARLETRQRRIPGWLELTWADIEHVKGYYSPWNEDRLIVDMVNSPAENLQAVLTFLQ
jgi:hypothetical protein